MRILHVIRTLHPRWGGPVETVRSLTSISRQAGIMAEVLCLDSPHAEWLASWETPVHAIGPAYGGVYGYSRNLDKWLEANIRSFDVLVVEGIWMYFSSAVRNAAVRNKVPYYLFTHGMLGPWFKRRYPIKHVKKAIYWRLIEHRVLRDAATVFFTTEQERDLAQNAFRPYQCKQAVVQLGIAKQFFTGGDRSRQDVPQPGSQSLTARPYILFLGRIHEVKGVDLIILALSRLHERYSTHIRIVIAGPGDPRMIKKLHTLAARLGVAELISWVGPVYGETKWALMEKADALILPSHQESYGVGVVEALACGTPVLISDKVNIWQEVDRARAGLVEPDTVEGTVRLLERWYELGSAEQEQMNKNAQDCFKSSFDLNITSASYLQYITQPLPLAFQN